MAANTTEFIRTSPHTPLYRAPFDGAASGAERASRHSDFPRHRVPGGAPTLIGDTDIYLYRSCAIVERLRLAVADRGEL